MIQGQRIEIDLGSDDEQAPTHNIAASSLVSVKDVLERQPVTPKPPTAPTFKSKDGFPQHRRRDVQSRFKQRQTQNPLISPNASSDTALPSGQSRMSPAPAMAPVADKPAGANSQSWEEEERKRIDQENRQKLEQMSPEEIEEERRELMNSLNPAILQRLLQRAHLDSGSMEVDLSSPLPESTLPKDAQEEKPPTETLTEKPSKTVRFASSDGEAPQQSANDHDESSSNPSSHGDVHFPRAPQPPDLDLTSESFFTDLHQKYFPSLPPEPEKLEWMQSSTPSKATYDPSAQAFNAGELRFSFRGELIPPKTAIEIPVSAGLHHHGDAPEAAGYTIAELAHLARSSYAAQRSIAFQTLGRFLYRLSKGEFGDPGEPGQDRPGAEETMGELARGLWREVERLRVIDTLTVESEGSGVDGGRHVSAKAYATEALWLWQRGGGRKWQAA